MIKNPFNFWIGVFCGVYFMAGIALHRDAFVLRMSALAMVLKLTE